MSSSIAASDALHLKTREERIRAAFYRGAQLTLENPEYVRALASLTDELLREDSGAGDLTVAAMGLGGCACAVEIRAKEAGVAAGIAEAAWLYGRLGQSVGARKNDGESIAPGDVLLRVEGHAGELLKLERVVVNLLQRMCGIATATRRVVEANRRRWSATHIVGTRKTPWGLLDKRALHLGGGGTHRLSLSDAILIKTNHLRLSGEEPQQTLAAALWNAWANRQFAAFFEVEVTSTEESLNVARILASLQGEGEACPCLLLLDNFSAEDAAHAVQSLRERNLHDAVLLEASGGVSEDSVGAFAAAGVDAISLGALTHSVRALDLSAKLIPGAR